MKHWAPPPKLKPSEWAERNIKIPAGNKIPGLINFANAPYQREPLDMMIDPKCRRITLMWGAQTGKTQLINCGQAYFIAQRPCSQMMLQPSQGDLKTWLETKFNPMVEGNDVLQNYIARPRSREGVNNQQMKSYPGGWLMFAWSGSPKTMRGRSAPKIWCDEVDGYERTAEGDAVDLLWQRAATFGDERLLVCTSTPTIKGDSKVEDSFEAGDKRRYHIPCPSCGHKQTLKWSQVEWDKCEETGDHLPETSRYVCEKCEHHITHGEKLAALKKGEWIAEKPFRGHASYHLNELYSGFRKWADIVESFLEKKATNSLQTFVNVSLAETWEEEGEKTDPHSLYMRREHYSAQVPNNGLILIAGVDVQDDRIEGEIIAYGAGYESWGVEYFVLHGNPAEPILWEQLEQRLNAPYNHESGSIMHVTAAGIDSGHYTQQVYDFTKKNSHKRWWPLKGSSESGKPIVNTLGSKSNKGKVRLFTVGTDTAKELIYSRLGIANPGPGYCHFPMSYDEEYFLQLTAEKRVTKYQKGYAKKVFIKTRPRNEAVDCRAYALAAVTLLNPVFTAIEQKMQPKKVPTEDEQFEEHKKLNSSLRRKKPSRKRKNWATDI